MCNLDRLIPVELTDIWPHEAVNFTPWLAQEENLNLLGETLGMDLEFEEREVNVGDFQADILCRNTEDSSRVLVENQLTRTDHRHLGQILTYSVGLDVHTIIWIAKEFREEHLAALDRLNEITDERFRYFGIEIKVWRIGNSARAPQFEIVSQPNDWSRAMTRQTRPMPPEESESRQLRERYWLKLGEYLREVGSSIIIGRPQPNGNSVFLGIGRSGFRLQISINLTGNQIRVELDMFNPTRTPPHATIYFQLLRQQRDEIDPNFNGQLEWRETSNRVVLCQNNVDPMDETQWEEQHNWFALNLEKFYEVFRQRIRDLNADDWESLENEDDE